MASWFLQLLGSFDASRSPTSPSMFGGIGSYLNVVHLVAPLGQPSWEAILGLVSKFLVQNACFKILASKSLFQISCFKIRVSKCLPHISCFKTLVSKFVLRFSFFKLIVSEILGMSWEHDVLTFYFKKMWVRGRGAWAVMPNMSSYVRFRPKTFRAPQASQLN